MSFIPFVFALVSALSGAWAISKGRDKWHFEVSELAVTCEGKVFLFLWASTGWSVIHAMLTLVEVPTHIIHQTGISVILTLAHIQASAWIRK